MTSATTVFIALLRAVNVGGTGKLAMNDLKAICDGLGFIGARTYIASGNVVFRSAAGEAEVKAALEAKLQAHTGKPVGVVVRTGIELAAVLAATPFADLAANRTVAIFLDAAPPADAIDRVTGRAGEQIVAGARELYVHYGDGMPYTKLVIPAARAGTARNMNTVAKLVAMAAAA
ncbi:DUF1697 domain-containing protein [Polymorphobacter sp. PAMC 29334]|uniref:DUF1697 domain-containing protein n=1 Tax=Polymorphobacter sp. PAMC 29334 TaxID=2862331 RepID=UPI001C67F99E|nr:DUF1697 domain-containing protein [Polymorphobacter sp. PAMC 29334]QYE36168.1 DUF1697 domain-containing protein [Polymorphobacter sp. PAMC 29334]